MKLVISSDSDLGLDSSVSHHFGRCPFFTIVNLQSDEVSSTESVENPFFKGHSPGQVPAYINQLSADVMIAGGMGGRAISLFKQYGIQCSTGASGTVRSAVNNYLSGNLDDAAPCRESIAHGHGTDGYERRPVDRLREEAEYLLNKMNTVIVNLDQKVDGNGDGK